MSFETIDLLLSTKKPSSSQSELEIQQLISALASEIYVFVKEIPFSRYSSLPADLVDIYQSSKDLTSSEWIISDQERILLLFQIAIIKGVCSKVFEWVVIPSVFDSNQKQVLSRLKNLDNQIFSVRIPTRATVGTKLVKNVEQASGWLQGWIGTTGKTADKGVSAAAPSADAKDVQIEELKIQVQLLQKEKLDLQMELLELKRPRSAK